MKRWRICQFAALGVWLLVTPPLSLSSTSPAGIVTQVRGTANLQRIGVENILPVHFRDDVFLRDKITTKAESFVRLLLGGKAIVTVREMSILTITDYADHATIDIKTGVMGLSVARSRMKPGEYIEIRTPHAIAAVRGTKLTTEVGQITTFSMLEGHADYAPIDNPTNFQPLLEGMQVHATDEGVSTPQAMPPDVQEQKTEVTEAPDEPEESPVAEQVAEEQGDQATALAEALAPDSQTAETGDTAKSLLQTAEDPGAEPADSPNPLNIPTGVKLDTALIDASAPFLQATSNTTVTSTPGPETSGLLDLSFQAKVTSLGPVTTIDASSVLVFGSALNIGPNSALVVTGNAPEVTIGGIPSSLIGGAQPGQISVTGTPIKNLGLGIVNTGGGSLIQVDGLNATVDIQGN